MLMITTLFVVALIFIKEENTVFIIVLHRTTIFSFMKNVIRVSHDFTNKIKTIIDHRNTMFMQATTIA